MGAGVCGAVIRGLVRCVPCLLTKGFTICYCHSVLNTTIEISGLQGPPRPGDSHRLGPCPGPSLYLSFARRVELLKASVPLCVRWK